MTTLKNIKKGLRALGVRGRYFARYVQTDRVAVYVKGRYFGLWDAEKNTFVD